MWFMTTLSKSYIYSAFISGYKKTDILTTWSFGRFEARSLYLSNMASTAALAFLLPSSTLISAEVATMDL